MEVAGIGSKIFETVRPIKTVESPLLRGTSNNLPDFRGRSKDSFDLKYALISSLIPVARLMSSENPTNRGSSL